MGMMLFGHLFPERKELETRSLTLRVPLVNAGRVVLPADEYGFLDRYCIEPECDCREVILDVVARHAESNVATICHTFDPPGKNDPRPRQTFLDPLHRQSAFAPALLELFVEVVLKDDAYRERLLRHYAQVKAAVADPNHPCHRIIADSDELIYIEPARPLLSLSRSGITPPPPRRGKRKWR